MGNIPTNDFRHLFNDMPAEERSRLMPYLVQSQRLHIWQTQQHAIKAHQALMAKLNEQMSNLDSELEMYRAAQEEQGK